MILPNLIRRDIISFLLSFLHFYSNSCIVVRYVQYMLQKDVKYDKTMVAYCVNS